MSDFTAAEAVDLFDDEPPLATGEVPDMPEVQAEGETQDKTGETPASDEAPPEVSEEEDEDGDKVEPEKVIDPPANWSDEGKVAFASAPPELQQYLLKHEAEIQAEVGRRQVEAAEARKQASAVQELFTNVDTHLKNTQDVFDAKWRGITQDEWDALAYTNPEQHKALKAEYTAEQKALETVRTQRAQAETIARDQWVKEQAEVIRRDLPELSNPETSDKLVKYALNEGITMDELNGLSAVGFKVLMKAFRAEHPIQPKTPATPAAQPAPNAPAVKPSLKSTGVEKRGNQFTRFEKDPSRENAAALFT